MREMPTVYEVAELAGVSTASVSRVLAGNDRVRPETRAKVLAAVAELGYVPSGAAQNLANRRTGVLGLCFPDPVGDQDIVESDTMYWYDEVIRGMERSARRSGFAVLIAASHESDDESMVTMVASRCDGLAVLAHTVPSDTLERLAQRMPVIMLAAPREPEVRDSRARPPVGGQPRRRLRADRAPGGRARIPGHTVRGRTRFAGLGEPLHRFPLGDGRARSAGARAARPGRRLHHGRRPARGLPPAGGRERAAGAGVRQRPDRGRRDGGPAAGRGRACRTRWRWPDSTASSSASTCGPA